MATAFAPLGEERLWRIPVDRYHALIRAGAFTPDDRVELLEGVLVERMPKSPGHRIAVRRAYNRLVERLLPGWYVDSEAPITLADSEPEPDLCIVHGCTEDYANRHPGPRDLALVIEVSDSTLDRDRGWKRRIYARSQIAQYWLINLKARSLEVHTLPKGDNFTGTRTYRSGESVTLSDFATGEIAVDDLLPPAEPPSGRDS